MIRISIHTERKYRHRFDGIAQVRNLLGEAGYRIDFAEKTSSRNKSDVAWMQGSLLRSCPEDSQPKICYERFASGTIGDAENLSRKDVALYTKEICYNNKSNYLLPLIDNRLHTSLISKNSARLAKPNPLLEEVSLDKISTIHAIYRQTKRFDAYFSRRHQKLASAPAHKRHIDVFFSGNIDFKDNGDEISGKLITEHRKTLTRIMASNLPDDIVVLLGLGRCFDREIFRSQLVNSKIFVSPYGWGEYSWKDFEAVISGCILIKPECKFLKSYGPRLYEEGVIQCRPDFSDLTAIITNTLGNIEEATQKAQDLRMEFVKARFDNEGYARDVASTLSEIISSQPEPRKQNRFDWFRSALRRPALPQEQK